MSALDARRLAFGAGALVCVGCAGNAFLQVAPSGGTAQHRLRAGASASAPSVDFEDVSAFSGSSLPAVSCLAAAAVALSARAVSRRAAAVKKKGVRVVEGKEIPWNLFAPKAPYKGTVVSKDVITTKTELVNWETCHAVLRHDKNVPYVEGQSIGIVAPGPDKKGETPAKIRLYSIASSACGDDESSETVSLCVKRVLEVEGRSWCNYSNIPEGKRDPEFPEAEKVYRGVCSSHICDLKTGDDVLITGPTGAEMLLPEDPTANIIMMATGTGIAPFRSFLRKLFHDKATKNKFKGVAWLFLGVPFTNSILYDEEWSKMHEEFGRHFRYDYAISDEMNNKEGNKMYVQHKVQEYADEIWPMLKDAKTHVYMCGLKGMESGFLEAFGPSLEKEGVDGKEFVKTLKKDKRYHVEVY